MLEILVGAQRREKLLGWLMTHPEERYFVRQLTTILKEDSTNVSRELARLAQAGILVSESEGRQKYYRANRLCPVFEELRSLAIKTFAVGDILRQALQPLADRIRVAYIYGSFAQTNITAQSDVDIMVIGDVSFADVNRALRPAQEKLQRETNPSVYPVAEFQTKLAGGHHFLGSVLKGDKIYLIGDEHELGRLEKERLDRLAQRKPLG